MMTVGNTVIIRHFPKVPIINDNALLLLFLFLKERKKERRRSKVALGNEATYTVHPVAEAVYGELIG